METTKFLRDFRISINHLSRYNWEMTRAVVYRKESREKLLKYFSIVFVLAIFNELSFGFVILFKVCLYGLLVLLHFETFISPLDHDAQVYYKIADDKLRCAHLSGMINDHIAYICADLLDHARWNKKTDVKVPDYMDISLFVTAGYHVDEDRTITYRPD